MALLNNNDVARAGRDAVVEALSGNVKEWADFRIHLLDWLNGSVKSEVITALNELGDITSILGAYDTDYGWKISADAVINEVLPKMRKAVPNNSWDGCRLVLIGLFRAIQHKFATPQYQRFCHVLYRQLRAGVIRNKAYHRSNINTQEVFDFLGDGDLPGLEPEILEDVLNWLIGFER